MLEDKITPRLSMLKLTHAIAHLRWHTFNRLNDQLPRVICPEWSSACHHGAPTLIMVSSCTDGAPKDAADKKTCFQYKNSESKVQSLSHTRVWEQKHMMPPENNLGGQAFGSPNLSRTCAHAPAGPPDRGHHIMYYGYYYYCYYCYCYCYYCFYYCYYYYYYYY